MRYTGPRLRRMRALGVNLPGLSSKGIDRRSSPPGMKSGGFRKKKSDYGLQLMEKQKLRFHYSVGEKYLRKMVHLAFRSREHAGYKLLELLESRLDNVVFRAGLSPTISGARQLVGHKHVYVDGKKVNIPSYRILPGQTVSLTEKGSKIPGTVYSMENPSLTCPPWLSADDGKFKMIAPPDKDSLPFPVEISQIMEFYARRVKR